MMIRLANWSQLAISLFSALTELELIMNFLNVEAEISTEMFANCAKNVSDKLIRLSAIRH